MHEMTKKRNRLIAEQVIKSLSLRNMEAFFAETREDAKKLALDIIPEGSSVGCGGVMTAHEIGLIDSLRNGNYDFIDRDACKTPEEKHASELRMLSDLDYFITSANGMSENGIIVNVDGNANRVACIAQGPRHVLFIVGMNKIVHSEMDAYNRAKYIAAPINAQRFGLDTPCAKTGKCADCFHEQCICDQILITRKSRHKDRIKVILVNEELGF